MTLTLTQEPDTQTWPKYGQDVLAYQKSSFYVKGFKSYSLNRQRQKHGHTDRHTDTQTDITENVIYPHT